MLSPVDFISGPNALFTLWNLLKEKTGCLMAYPFNWVEFEISYFIVTQHYFRM
jgi:hypothetical protein